MYKRYSPSRGSIGVVGAVCAAGLFLFAWGSDGGHAAAEPKPIDYYADKWAVAPRWSAAPVIDGNLSEPLWNSAALLDNFRTAHEGEGLPYEVQYKVAYDDDYLYIGATMDEEEAATLARIEIVLSPASHGDEHFVSRLIVDPTDSSTTDTIWSPHASDQSLNAGRTLLTGIEYSITASGGYTFVEAAIPLSAVAAGGVYEGAEWRMNIVHIHEAFVRPLTSWMPIRSATNWDRYGNGGRLNAGVVNQGRLGSLFFGKLADSFVPEVGGSPADAIRWTPEAGLLAYSEFAKKKVSFEYSGGTIPEENFKLFWKSPDRAWEAVPIDAVARSGSTYDIAFSHAEPYVEGMYQLRIVALPSSSDEALAATLAFDKESMIASGLSIAPSLLSSGTEPVHVTPQAASSRVVQSLALIPEQPGFRYVGLPEMPELYPDGLYALSSDGRSIVATRTDTAYPNVQYEEDRELATINAKGETVRIPYYENNEGKKFFLTGHLWYLQKDKALGETLAIAQNDPLGAARMLYRFAERYEGYNPTIDQAWYNRSFPKQAGAPFSYWGGMWYRWYGSDLQSLLPLVQAYSLVKQTDAFEVLSAEVGVDVEKKLVEEMFRPSVDYVLKHAQNLGNLSSTNWNGLIELGKALREPDYIHHAVNEMEQFMQSLFMADGFWNEVSLSYHTALINGIQSASDRLQGWTDPEGYVSPRTGRRLTNLDMATQFPIIAKALEHSRKLVYPNGHYYPVQDTWAYDGTSNPAELGSLLLPSAGIGRLTGGEGLDQTQLYLAYQPKYPTHIHYDPLNLGLYAQKQELLPDLGYTFNTKYRWFSLSTMSHNTVVVDSKNAQVNDTSVHGGDIELFVPRAGGSQAMRASYESAYPGVSEYRREPWYVPFADGDGQQGYVLDLFRVEGGSRHEYTLQGDANRDAYFTTGHTLDEYGPYLLPPGTRVVEPVDNLSRGSAEGHYEGYIYVRDVKQAQLPDDRYEVTLVTEEDGVRQSGMHITGLLESGSNELFLGRSPSLRAARLEGKSKDNNDEADKYTMPKLVLRRDGTNLSSTFATVLEPFRDADGPRIEAIDRLEPQQAPAGAVAVQVAYGDTVDLLLSNPDYAVHQQPLIVGDVALYGETGLIRLVNGQVLAMELAAGTRLEKAGDVLVSDGAITGTVADTLRTADGAAYNGILTTAAVPQTAVGTYLILAHPDGSAKGFAIEEVRRHEGKTLLVLAGEDPGFVLQPDGSSKQTYFPHKHWPAGVHTFRIANVERSTSAGSAPSYSNVGTVSGSVYDPAGQPVSGAAVNVTGNDSMAAITGTDGTYAITGVPEGWRRITVNHPGFVRTVSDAVYVSKDQTRVVPIGFTTRVAPVIADATPIGVLAGVPVTATSSVYGAVYLVAASTPANIDAIRAAVSSVGQSVYGQSAPALPDVPVSFDTTGMPEGRYALYAIDTWDNVSVGKELVIMARYEPYIDDSHALIRSGGTWSVSANPSSYGGASRQSRATGSFLEIPFYGRGTKVLSMAGASRGNADVYVDGAFQARIDTYSPTVKYKQEVYDTGVLEEGMHVIRLVVTGERNEAASNAFVNFDALQVGSIGPSLSHATAGAVAAGNPASAISSKAGMLYLVPFDTEASRNQLEAVGASVYGRAASVSANVYGSLSTTGLPDNWYRLYAIDTGGYVSSGSAPFAIIDGSVERDWIDDSAAVAYYSGTWTEAANDSSYGASSRQSRTAGDYVELAFYGTRAQVASTVGASRGKAGVYVDGVYKETIDLYSPTVKYQHTVYDTGTLSEGVHRIRLVVTGEKQAAATQAYVNFDALRLVHAAPELSGATAGAVVKDGMVAATSSKPGTIYFVPYDTEATPSAVALAGGSPSGLRAAALAGTPVTLDTTGLSSGWYRLYAADAAGRLSAGSEGVAIIDPAVQPGTIDDTDPLVRYSSVWSASSNASAFGGSSRQTSAAGVYADIPFYGTQAKVLSLVGSSRGIADIYIDGIYRNSVDMYSSSVKYKHPVYDTGALAEGAHVLRIVVTGTRGVSATAAIINLDAVEVTND
jgi:hypothetical protein